MKADKQTSKHLLLALVITVFSTIDRKSVV